MKEPVETENHMLDSAKLTELFPHVRFHSDWHLMTWHPQGVLTEEQADRMVEFLETLEPIAGQPFNRFTDLSGYTRIQISLDQVVRLARRRRQAYGGPPVKSAFYAVRLISLTIARLYEELMRDSRIEVRTFQTRAAAASWLGVPPTILHPPKTGPK